MRLLDPRVILSAAFYFLVFAVSCGFFFYSLSMPQQASANRLKKPFDMAALAMTRKFGAWGRSDFCRRIRGFLTGLRNRTAQRLEPVLKAPLFGPRGERASSVPVYRPFLLLSFLIGFLPLALRYKIGTDYVSNQQGFSLISLGAVKPGFGIEPGYWIITFLSAKLHLGFAFPMAVFALITLVFFYKSLIYFSKRISAALGLVIFYFLYYGSATNIVKQFVALSLIFYSFRYIHERRPIRFAAFVVAASLFHYSAVVALILYVLSIRKPWMQWVRYGLMAALFPLTMFMGNIMNFSIRHLPLFNKYAYYHFANTRFGFFMLVYLAFYAFLFFTVKKTGWFASFLTDILLIGCIVSYAGNLGTDINNAIGRIHYYFTIDCLLVFPMMIRYTADRKWKRAALAAMLILLLGYWGYYSVLIGVNEYIPYHFILIR